MQRLCQETWQDGGQWCREELIREERTPFLGWDFVCVCVFCGGVGAGGDDV